jgi:hypothetical protein
MAARDTAQRAVRMCERLGVLAQQTLTGEEATADAVLGALRDVGAVLADDGLLVLTFSGHTERGEGPIESAHWCLVGGGVTLSQVANQLAQLPATARLLVIADTCYASAIAQVLTGPQPVIVLASCGEDQTMVDRPRSEFVTRLEQSVCSTGALGSIEALRELLEADTPDCERPVVWSNAPRPQIASSGT